MILKIKTGRIGINNLYSIGLLFVSLMYSGCKKDNASVSGESNYNIYTAGYYYDNGWKSCYWKGTVRTDLNDSLVSAMATSLFVYEGNVYTSGYYTNSIDIPCYWKNTERIDLSGDEVHSAYTTDIYVSNGSVYIAGCYNNGTKTLPCYWENEIRKEIEDFPSGSNANIQSIFVSDGDVYLCGYYSAGSASIPCFWKNNVRTDLPLSEGSTSCIANSVYVYNGTVYTAGNDDFFRNPCYWEGTNKTNLFDGTGSATSVFVSDGEVYTAGGTDTPCFWKGTNKTILNGVNLANSIYVKDGNVFTAGYYINENQFNRPHVICYWEGTKRVDLPVTGDPADSHANTAISIFVE